MQVGVYLCMKIKLDMFEWSGSQALREVGLWFRGVSNVSLRRQMKRRGVQRERESLCLCLSRCVICSRLSKHLQSAGSPGMQRQGRGWEQQPWETAALLNLCRLVPPQAECQHRQCQRCVRLIVTGPVSSYTHTSTHAHTHTSREACTRTHTQLQQAHGPAHCLACRRGHIKRLRQKPEAIACSRSHACALHSHAYRVTCI